jgi:hypothetical protein
MRRFAGITLLVCLLSASPAFGEEASYEEYADRVSTAADVATESRLAAGGAQEAQELASRLEELLPPGEEVRFGEVVLETDDAVLHAQIAKLRAAGSSEERREYAESIATHLATLRRDVLAEGARGEPPADPDALEELLRPAQIDREALRERIARMAEAFARWFAERWMGLGGAGETGVWVARVVIGAILLALLVLAVWVVRRVVLTLRASRPSRTRRHRTPETVEPIVPAAEGLPEDALAHAEELALQGRLRDAVRALFGGAARSLVERGWLEQTRTLTNAELLAEVRPQAPRAYTPLASLSGVFEKAWYGRLDPTPEGFERARQDYEAVVDEPRADASGRAGR